MIEALDLEVLRQLPYLPEITLDVPTSEPFAMSLTWEQLDDGL